MNIKLAIAGALLAFGFAAPAMAAPYGDYGRRDDDRYQGDNDRHHGDYGRHDDDRYQGDYGRRHGDYGRRHAQWELIGATQVSFRAERDTIRVHGYDRHRQIMVCVYNRPVRFLDMDVRFDNGGRQDIGVRNVIGAGQCTRAIDLDGRRRDIRSVSFAYMSIPGYRQIGRFAQPATVRVYAR